MSKKTKPAFKIDMRTPLRRAASTEVFQIDFDPEQMREANENGQKAAGCGYPELFVKKMFAKCPIVMAIVPDPARPGVYTTCMMQGRMLMLELTSQGRGLEPITLDTATWHCKSIEAAERMSAAFSTEAEISFEAFESAYRQSIFMWWEREKAGKPA